METGQTSFMMPAQPAEYFLMPQVNIGFGFYGRSFQLASSECTTPGVCNVLSFPQEAVLTSDPQCPFSGPADAGPCTNNPGTLSFAEIGDIINNHGLEPILDEEAAVKYIVWNDDQWVSYDDAESFKLKVDYLTTIVGGSMVWSGAWTRTILAHYPEYFIRSGSGRCTIHRPECSLRTSSPCGHSRMLLLTNHPLQPDADYNNASSTQSNQCKSTGCGESCPNGWSWIAGLTTPANGPSCPANNRASFCCPQVSLRLIQIKEIRSCESS
jgi:hypothetical protein